ncbi:MAG TPA: ZIP family metal transporter [Acholeplasma sp.]|jgi:ZIP family zinc transporter|nr:ZIP family metal transporter [Acholeplasma sp.]
MFGLDAKVSAFLGIALIFLATTGGSALVYLVKNKLPKKVFKGIMGFASGVMMSAAIFSLLIPSLDLSLEKYGDFKFPYFPAIIGLVLGIIFLMVIDRLVPHLHQDYKQEGLPSNLKQSTMLFLGVSLHNIPEGLSVGFAFGVGIASGNYELVTSAAMLSIGIAIQNFPEGAAVSLCYRQSGYSKTKSFLLGMFSGLVEPIFAVLGILFATLFTSLMPWLLAFAAGAMIYIIIEELLPASVDKESHSHIGVISFFVGFVIMLVIELL